MKFKSIFDKKSGLVIIAGIAAVAFIASGFAIGYKYGKMFPQTVEVKDVSNATEGQPSSVDFGTFWQTWQIIGQNYLNASKIKSQDEVYGAIDGLVKSLNDPYSVFLPPQQNEKFQEDVQGNFGGIGVEIGMKKNQLVVVAPLKDTPGMRAGLKPGDMILKINATSTDGLSIDEAVNLIRGPENTDVTLNIFRDGWDKPRDFKITRATIMVPTLDMTMESGNIAYIQLYQFNANASYLFSNAANKALSQGAKGIVLDLRNNPGGYLDVAVDLGGWFLPKQTLIVKEESGTGDTQSLYAEGNGALKNIPVVVLINGGSASASEILAGALRDDRGVKLIGEKSFGKGTVQQLIPLRDGSTIKLTIAHWVLPSGKILENGGLDPDVEVKMTDDDIANKKDPQLDKALEVLRGEIAQQ
ncbi:MAG TPA: S41 family peptidase [Candidatus Paceibacterota bacterium]|nr:S41 family peptidase [Candidatus Paceibacterota bacterium]